MDEKILFLCQKLNFAIKNDARFLELDSLEKQINDNDEVIKLSYRKDVACTKYSDLLKIYSEDNECVQDALKELNEAKFALDTHPLVSKYLKAYSEVKQILFEVNSILFSPYLNKECR